MVEVVLTYRVGLDVNVMDISMVTYVNTVSKVKSKGPLTVYYTVVWSQGMNRITMYYLPQRSVGLASKRDIASIYINMYYRDVCICIHCNIYEPDLNRALHI